MQFFNARLLGIIVIVAILFLGCSSQEVQEKEQPLEKQSSKAEDTTKQIVDATQTTVQPVSNITTPTTLSLEPIVDPTLGWDDVNENNFSEIREPYILQHLQKPENIVWALENSMPKRVANFLEKGYGVYYWPTAHRFPKELELGFMAARNKNEVALEENLQTLNQQGRSKNYILLSYIASWYYCLVGKNDKAKNLIQSSELERYIAFYTLNIPDSQLRLLQNKSQQDPTFVAPPEPVKVSKPVEQPTNGKPADSTPTDEVPVDSIPTDEVPVDSTPTDEVPVDSTPTDEVPVDSTPTDEIPVDSTPIDEIPVDEGPTTGTVTEEDIPEEP